MAGAADDAGAEALRRQRVDLAVAMARDQHLGAILGAPDERGQEVLAVPHGDDHRRVAGEPLVDAIRLDRKPGRLPYQTKVLGRHNSSRLLERARANETLYPRHRLVNRATSALAALIGFGIEQPVQMHDEVAHMGIVDGLLGLRLPGDISGGVIGINADDVQLARSRNSTPSRSASSPPSTRCSNCPRST